MDDKSLTIEFARVTEHAAISVARFIGRGDEEAADRAAVESMRGSLEYIDIDGTIVIGEGERDEAPMLYIGEKVGSGKGQKVDIAVDPLEGTTLAATSAPNAIAVMAIGDHGNFLHAPDTYMEKIAVGPKARGVIDIKLSSTENLQRIAEALNRYIEDLTVIILKRERHKPLIEEVRKAGARIRLIQDGDVAGAIATAKEDSGIDVLMGIGGAPEGVLGAAALRCVGGDMQGRLVFRNEEERGRALKMGIKDFDKIYGIHDLAAGDVIFVATGVTNGDYLNGVKFFQSGAKTHSVVMRSKTGTIRYIEATHYFNYKEIK
ncbi:class II fructose-bisphosphatase [Candidatus Acidulodesulfobacterium sp. H_13]|uniref:class II fructose-bisphosphatase n=1 Tax=Candidatus Acidulodesulfobacterium sp. H_13 TaxID=3395470 RepID=UPI003AF95A5C